MQPRPPSIDALARGLANDSRLARLGHPVLVECAREAVAELTIDGSEVPPALFGKYARAKAEAALTTEFQSVINATGVLLHTNLGRAPRTQIGAASEIPSAGGGSPLVTPGPIRYNNVEFDLGSGKRGSRRAHVEPSLAALCGSHGALVTNNCAAALVLVLATFAKGREVVVSRGELVEIGGGFRIPEVLEQSGARLVEVGTTNRTRANDFRQAIDREGSDVAVLLKVHTSNYRIVGFTEDTSIEEMCEVSSAVPGPRPLVIHDIGSGLLDERTPWLADKSGERPNLEWLKGEPGVRQSIAAGADLAVFSADKLLGGPQGGVIVGSKELVDACATHPLARALRVGSLVIEALQETLSAYQTRDLQGLPLWKLATVSVDALAVRAASMIALAAGRVNGLSIRAVPMGSVVGGGTMPGTEIASFGLEVNGVPTATELAHRLRNFTPSIVGRVDRDSLLLDLRTVDETDDSVIVAGLVETSR